MINQIKKLLTPYQYNNLQRYGGNYDGAYILASDLLASTEYIYSYGVGPNETWITFDRNMIDLDKHVFMYDNLVNGFWTSHPYIHFKSEYVNSQNIVKHIIENNHNNNTNMVLKMDIEGNEFETLLNCSDSIFNHFNQIAIEIHDVVNSHLEPQYIINANNINKRWDNKINLFNKLNKYYYLVHIHGNNNSYQIIDGLPDVLELLYIRKDSMTSLIPLREKCPRQFLDFPNDKNKPDIIMDWWI